MEVSCLPASANESSRKVLIQKQESEKRTAHGMLDIKAFKGIRTPRD